MGTGAAPNLVDDLCHTVLDAVGSYYDDMAPDLRPAPLPALRYVPPGLPPWDCEQVTVHLEGTAAIDGDANLQASTGLPMLPGFAMRRATLVIQVVRCVPSWSADSSALGPARRPPVEQDETVARAHNADSQMVESALLQAVRDGKLSGENGAMVIAETGSAAIDDLAGIAVRAHFNLTFHGMVVAARG